MPEQFPTLPPHLMVVSFVRISLPGFRGDLWAGTELRMRAVLVSCGLALTMQNGGAERLLRLQGGRNWREEGYSEPDSSAFH